MATHRITDHPKLQYKGRPIERYLQDIDTPTFADEPRSKRIWCTIHIKHYGVEDNLVDKTYLGEGYSLCNDIIKTMEASNRFMVNPTTSVRVALIPAVEEVRDELGNITQEYVAAHYPVGSVPEYDYWFAVSENLPVGATIRTLLASQMIEFCTKTEVNTY